MGKGARRPRCSISHSDGSVIMEYTQSLEPEKIKAAGVLDAPATALEFTTRRLNSNTKTAHMLIQFVKLGKRGLNCFEASNKHHDYVLRTTVSYLQRNYGLMFSKNFEQVPNAFGTKTDCVRYWLDDANLAKAVTVLGIEGAV